MKTDNTSVFPKLAYENLIKSKVKISMFPFKTMQIMSVFEGLILLKTYSLNGIFIL